MAFQLHNRRYTGSKLKLSDWICDLIQTHCKGKSFVDLFAGTAIISFKLLPHFDEITLNDFLHSNKIIYESFFNKGKYNINKLNKFKIRYLNFVPKQLSENYASENFGGKFFSEEDAKLIGHIRCDLDKNRKNLTHREYNILVASLLYSMDRCANTVGHYDAYIRKKSGFKRFMFDLITPIDLKNKTVVIHKEDANKLVKNIKSDIVYIDPPYNSRQYSRFYHVLENITRWEKPQLFGVARKPLSDNMSEYCRVNAPETFRDLIENVNCKYIVVSYNNTYNSKSKSSANKIEHEFIISTLKKRGLTKVFCKKHNFFNAGKTDFVDHKEFVFITKTEGVV